jgi:pilus assembly protein Flp/PilA
MLKSFLKDETGATAIEYGLIVAIISVALLSTYLGIQTGLKSTYTRIGNALE